MVKEIFIRLGRILLLRNCVVQQHRLVLGAPSWRRFLLLQIPAGLQRRATRSERKPSLMCYSSSKVSPSPLSTAFCIQSFCTTIPVFAPFTSPLVSSFIDVLTRILRLVKDIRWKLLQRLTSPRYWSSVHFVFLLFFLHSML